MNATPATEYFSAHSVAGFLQSHTRTAISRLRVLDQTDSTNAQLLAEPAPEVGFEVLFAQAQSAGRGRRGRRWHSPKGAHLYLSMAFIYRGALARLPPLALAVGVACAEAIESATGLPIRLKWPNDLYLDGRKLGGILIETQPWKPGQVHVVVGIGLNVQMPEGADAHIGQPWADLRASARPVDRNRLAAAVLDQVVTAVLKFENEGFEAFQTAYAGRDLLLDRDVTLHEPEGSRLARACGVDGNGALCVVDVEHGAARRLHAGEVSVRL